MNKLHILTYEMREDALLQGRMQDTLSNKLACDHTRHRSAGQDAVMIGEASHHGCAMCGT